ncbi:MAG: YoaK family protein [Phycisphaerales bacterium]
MPSLKDHKFEFIVVLFGGLGLAGIAGYINTLVITLGAPPVTHMTGTISRLSSDMGIGDLHDLLMVSGLVAAFVLGAVCSGVVIGSSTLHIGRRYGIAILVEAALLAIAALTIDHSLITGAMLTAAAAGLQNAMAASYRSLIIRTTHLTGILTDLGFHLGQLITGHRTLGWHFLLLGSILIAFIIGGVLGVISSQESGSAGLWYPAGLLAIGGFGYFLIRLINKAKQSIPTAV